ncbi:pyridoxal-phosphate dependent enzyme-domain-containing protein [Halenospora varia]|nr:pyridoxal-phosphate dependent enzyme-domain-containing protein [Halenospora varia]
MSDPNKSPPLVRDSVIAAHALIKEHIHYTPVLTNATLTELASTPQTKEALASTQWAGQEPAKPKIRLWFKCENLQRVGAFKVRGAFHALKRLMNEEGWESGGGNHTGNHAQALALAAKTMNIPAYIVMPTISTPSKIAATKGYGAKVIFSGSTSTEREAVVADVIKDTGARLIPPYDHPDIMLGQGTLGLEFQEQVRRMIASGEEKEKSKGLDAIITPCGGGGMLSGTAISCEGTGVLVFGAEPEFEGADDCKRGLETGQRITTVKTLTIADGLRTPVGAYPWTIIHDRKLVRQMFSVTEDQIKSALRLVLERMKVVVEPSACVGLAVALYNEEFRALVEREGGEEGLEAVAKMFATSDYAAERQEGKMGIDGKVVAENFAG